MPTSPGHAPTRHTFTCIKTMHAARSQPGRLSLTDASSHLELRQHRCSKIFRPAQDTGTLSLCLCLPASLRRSMVFHVFVSLLRCRHISMIVDQTGRLDIATYFPHALTLKRDMQLWKNTHRGLSFCSLDLTATEVDHPELMLSLRHGILWMQTATKLMLLALVHIPRYTALQLRDETSLISKLRTVRELGNHVKCRMTETVCSRSLNLQSFQGCVRSGFPLILLSPA